MESNDLGDINIQAADFLVDEATLEQLPGALATRLSNPTEWNRHERTSGAASTSIQPACAADSTIAMVRIDCLREFECISSFLSQLVLLAACCP